MDTWTSAGAEFSSTPDSSGYGHDLVGYTAGNASSIAPGRWGNAVQFNPYPSYALQGALTTVALEPSQVTVVAWVKAASSPGAYRYIIADGGSSACEPSSYALYTGASGGLQFYIGDGSPGGIVSPDAGTGIWDGQWHAIAGTYDGSTVRLYVDGAEVGSGTSAIGSNIYYGRLADENFVAGTYPGTGCQRADYFYYGALDRQ
jgi:hypothetical protein